MQPTHRATRRSRSSSLRSRLLTREGLNKLLRGLAHLVAFPRWSRALHPGCNIPILGQRRCLKVARLAIRNCRISLTRSAEEWDFLPPSARQEPTPADSHRSAMRGSMANKRSQQSVRGVEHGKAPTDGGLQSQFMPSKGGRNATTNESRRGAG